jgi:hypothetical protein
VNWDEPGPNLRVQLALQSFDQVVSVATFDRRIRWYVSWASTAYALLCRSEPVDLLRLALTLNGTTRWPDHKALRKLGETRMSGTPATARQILERISDGLSQTTIDLRSDKRAFRIQGCS